MTENIQEILEAMIPKRLDDIIRQNRHRAQLYMTTDEQIMELHHQIVPNEPKDIMDHWSFITLHIINHPIAQIMLLGDIRGTTVTRLTSLVKQIDLDRQLVITNSGSLYRLGTQQQGEPNTDQLMAICAVFHGWGFGEYLGVPHFLFS
jgi:predicted Abi (CAAX) family protease